MPLLAVPLLAGAAGEAVDDRTLRFLFGRSLAEKEEEEKRRKAELEEFCQGSLARARELYGSKRKRKKRRKRRTPRTSSLPGRARRRQRQWFASSAGFTSDDVPRVMFPSGVVWPMMLRIMAGMVQKDSCSGMARLVLLLTVHLVLCFLPSLQARDAWHHGQYGPEGLVCCFFYDAPRVVLPSLSSGPRCPSSWPAWTTGQLEPYRCSSWTCPLLCYVWCLGPDGAVLAVPQLQFITVVVTECCFAEADPHGPGCSDDLFHSTVAAL